MELFTVGLDAATAAAAAAAAAAAVDYPLTTGCHQINSPVQTLHHPIFSSVFASIVIVCQSKFYWQLQLQTIA